VQIIQVSGQVKYPGTYPLSSSASLIDVITAAGGLTESAFMKRAELTSFATGETNSGIELKSIDLANELIQGEEQSTPLRSKDVLNILKIPDWFENEVVELAGEFVFPGKYQLQKGETLKQLIDRAGGFTERASLGSAVFLREELKLREQANLEKAVDELRQQLANNNLSNNPYSKQVDYENAKLVLEELLDTKPVGRLVVDLENIVDGRSPTPIELKDGDKLIVSNISPAISVIGEVFVPTTHLFEPQLNTENYLNKSGGVKKYGDKDSIYIVRANGSVVPYAQSYWFSSEPDFILQKGDTIVVPRDLPNYDNISLWQGVTQIVYQTAVALAAIGSL
jgi:protein involved in polysaccharide export with SLBB domain